MAIVSQWLLVLSKHCFPLFSPLDVRLFLRWKCRFVVSVPDSCERLSTNTTSYHRTLQIHKVTCYCFRMRNLTRSVSRCSGSCCRYCDSRITIIELTLSPTEERAVMHIPQNAYQTSAELAPWRQTWIQWGSSSQNQLVFPLLVSLALSRLHYLCFSVLISNS